MKSKKNEFIKYTNSINLKCEGGLRIKGKYKKSLLNKPLITVITVVYNGETYIEDTIKSIINQTYDNLEYIIIDGRSTDRTVDIIKKYDSNIDYWISEPDRGLSHGWNKGIFLSTGDAILLLNVGDIYFSDSISVFASNYNKTKIVCASALLVNNKRVTQGTIHPVPKKLLKGMYVPHNYCLIPKSIYETFGIYAEIKYSMDFEWFYRYFKKFGSNGFAVVSMIAGEYLLGGISDEDFIKGFVANAKIKIRNGEPLLKAWVYCGRVIIKHWVKKYVFQKRFLSY